MPVSVRLCKCKFKMPEDPRLTDQSIPTFSIGGVVSNLIPTCLHDPIVEIPNRHVGNRCAESRLIDVAKVVHATRLVIQVGGEETIQQLWESILNHGHLGIGLINLENAAFSGNYHDIRTIILHPEIQLQFKAVVSNRRILLEFNGDCVAEDGCG